MIYLNPYPNSIGTHRPTSGYSIIVLIQAFLPAFKDQCGIPPPPQDLYPMTLFIGKFYLPRTFFTSNPSVDFVPLIQNRETIGESHPFCWTRESYSILTNLVLLVLAFHFVRKAGAQEYMSEVEPTWSH